MNRHAVLAALMLACGTAASAADRTYSITSFDRVRVEGPYRVTLTTGVAPFARASGSPAAIDGLAIDVQGRTLVVRPSRSAWGGYPGEQRGPVEIAVGTHDLTSAWLNGSGSLSVDRIKGLSFDLSLQGSGAVAVGDSRVDQLKIALSGAGSARLAGSAPKLTAVVRGTSVLDATKLQAKDATIGAEGPAEVRLTVTQQAKVDARGVANVTLSGSPACTIRAAGSATVSGCAARSGR